MIFSAQYYRPPFPTQARWAADLAEIASVGFDAIYVAACWSWIEAEPGAYRFDDFDRLLDQAAQAGLKVIINLWSEVQPVWIHRLHPDASMIDHTGSPVRSSQLAYMQFGLTPGCCTDHPAVRASEAAFLAAVAGRYARAPNLSTWDCWNEMRWMSQADGYVCFCEHSVERYRNWLRKRYGTLDALNAAWHRRYIDWADVMPPKAPARSYTDTLQWQQFITERIAQELRRRYECVRGADPQHPIIAHAAFPSVYNTGEYFEYEPALGRGNDWELARLVDGYGCSHFPRWFHPAPIDYSARLESVRCATGRRPYWIAELQGGAAGHGAQAMQPVTAAQQTQWIWNGIARGAKGINFWCWRDEVFGRESGGFGVSGDDGYRDERLRALRNTATHLKEHAPLLDAYQPLAAQVAVVFEPLAYQFDWASHAAGGLAPLKDPPYTAGHSMQGYLRALERMQIPYEVIEPSFTDSLDRYRFLILPYPIIVDREFRPRLRAYVVAGGTLLTEASLDAFDDVGLFAYPAERSLPQSFGLRFSARRPLSQQTAGVELDGQRFDLHCARWLEELSTLEDHAARLMQVRNVVRGRVIAVGSFIGLAYWQQRYAEFERFLKTLVNTARAGPRLRCSVDDGERVQWRFGYSGLSALLFVVNYGAAVEVEFECQEPHIKAAARIRDVLTAGAVICARTPDAVRIKLRLSEGGYRVIRFDSGISAQTQSTKPIEEKIPCLI